MSISMLDALNPNSFRMGTKIRIDAGFLTIYHEKSIKSHILRKLKNIRHV